MRKTDSFSDDFYVKPFFFSFSDCRRNALTNTAESQRQKPTAVPFPKNKKKGGGGRRGGERKKKTKRTKILKLFSFFSFLCCFYWWGGGGILSPLAS